MPDQPEHLASIAFSPDVRTPACFSVPKIEEDAAVIAAASALGPAPLSLSRAKHLLHHIHRVEALDLLSAVADDSRHGPDTFAQSAHVVRHWAHVFHGRRVGRRRAPDPHLAPPGHRGTRPSRSLDGDWLLCHGLAANLCPMRAQRLSSRLLILLCICILQLQLFASAAMACKHAPPPGDQTVNACPFHTDGAAPRGTADTSSLLDCQKCVLGLFFPLCQSPASADSIGLPEYSALEADSRFTHFYRFTPDLPYRPPISLPL